MTSDTKFLTESHEIMGGHAKVYRTSQNGGVYQLGVWVASECKSSDDLGPLASKTKGDICSIASA